MGDWGRAFGGEEPGSAREAPVSRNDWHRDLVAAAWARIAEAAEAARPAREAAEAAAREAAALDEAAAEAAREAERAAFNAARAANQAAAAVVTAAERAADALIVAQCATITASPCGGKRYTLENFEFSGCRLHRETTNWRFGNRVQTFLALPLEAVWSVSWECYKDGAPHRRFVHSQSGLAEVYPPDESEPRDAFASTARGLSHSPFAALLAKG